MRLLLLSDLHSDEHALENIKILCEREKFDYVFIAGDITKNTISYVDDLLETLPKCFAVAGNCDTPQVLEKLERNGNSVHGKRIELSEGLNVVGFGFSPPTPFHTYGEMSEDEIEKEMSKLDIDNNTLLLTHAPPYGVFDLIRGEHIGSRAIRKIIEEKRPLANFCGHVHEYAGNYKIGATHIVKIPAANSYRYAIAKIINKKVDAEFLEM